MPFEIPDDDGWDDDVLLAADVTTGGNRGGAAPASVGTSSKQADLTMTVGTRASVEMRDATGAGTGTSHSFVTADSADRYPRVVQGHVPAPNPPPPAPAPRRTTVVAGPFDYGDDDDFLLEALAATERRAMSASAGPPAPRHDQNQYHQQPVRSDGRGHMPLQPVNQGQAPSGHRLGQPHDHQIPRHRHAGAHPGDPPNRDPRPPVPIDRDNYHRVQAGPHAPQPRRLTVELILEKHGGRVAVACRQGYDETVAAACRSIPGAAYDGRAYPRRWTVPDSAVADVSRALKSARDATVEVIAPVPMVLRALAVVSQLERAAAKAEAEASDGVGVGGGNEGGRGIGHENGDENNREGHENVTPLERAVERAYARVPESLRTRMFPFQIEGVKYGLSRGGRVLIGDQMGLGKTVQALALISCYREEWPCLILVPTSLRDAWHEALRRWLDVRPSLIASVGSGAEAHKINAATFAIVPYSLVGKMQGKLAARNFQVVVCDESHFIKDAKAQRTKAVVPLLKAARRAICLTGTPALSRPVELYSQVEALRPNVFTKFTEFAQRYCAGSRFGWQGCENPDELYAILSRLIMVRRLKRDVLTQLPPKRREQVYIALDKKTEAYREMKAVQEQLQRLRDHAKDNGLLLGAGGDGKMNVEEKRLMNAYYVASAKAKATSVQDYLETLLDGSGAGDKFLFFAHHKELLDAASAILRKRKTQFIRIDGATPTSERGGLVQQFQTVDAIKVAVLSIKAAGMGLTLTAASTVVFGELSWTPGDIVQAEDRAHRIGQASSVLVQFLHAKNSVDDVMWGSVQNKLENLGQVLDGHAGDHLEIHDDQTHRAKYRPPAGPDRSPGGGPLRATNFPGLGANPAPRTQATLDGFVARSGSQDAGSAELKRGDGQTREGNEDAGKRRRL